MDSRIGRPISALALLFALSLLACGESVGPEEALLVPTSLAATAPRHDRISITWTDQRAEDGYEIMRSEEGNAGPFVSLASVPADRTSLDDDAVLPERAYCYRVRAYENAAGRRRYSESSEAACATTPRRAGAPAPPSQLSASLIGVETIRLEWRDEADNEDVFRVERQADALSPWITVVEVAANVTAHDDAALPGDARACYRVSALNGEGTSTATGPACAAAPAAPSALAVARWSASALLLEWRDNSQWETGYEVERATAADGPFAIVATRPADATAHVDSLLATGTTYWYRVRAARHAGRSGTTNIASGTPTAAPPGPVASVDAIPWWSSYIAVYWAHESADESGYRVERSTSDAGPWVEIARLPMNETQTFDDGRTPEELVCYRVTAFNDWGDSPSAVDCTTPPAAPVDLRATRVDAYTYDLTWRDNSAVESGYIVYEFLRGNDGYSYWPLMRAEVPASQTSARITLDRTPSTWFEFYVVATAVGGGQSDGSEMVSMKTPPEPPADVQPVPVLSTAVSVRWIYAGYPLHFRIERSLDRGATWTVAGQAYHDWREFSDASRTPEQEVCYRVIVVEDDGVQREERSSWEVPALRDRCTRPPLGPTALTARAASWSTIDLAWADNSSVESGYRVERAVGGDPYFQAVATLGPGATAYRDTGRDPNTTYRYRVYALAGDGHSDPSNVAAVATPPAP